MRLCGLTKIARSRAEAAGTNGNKSQTRQKQDQTDRMQKLASASIGEKLKMNLGKFAF